MNRKGMFIRAIIMIACCIGVINNSIATENTASNVRNSNEYELPYSPPTEAELPKLKIVGAPASKTITEGGLKSIQIVIKLSETSSKPVRFNYRTIPGKASQGKDYQGVSGIGYIPVGELDYLIEVPVFDDNIPEWPENFHLELHYPQNATLDYYSSINCKIFDNDNDPHASLVDHEIYVSEEDGVAIVGIQLDRPSEKTAVVKCSTGQLSAKMWKDFKPLLDPFDVIVFRPGETLKYTSVKIKNDGIPEPTERFSVNLSMMLNCSCYDLEKCIVYITDGDILPSISIHDADAFEGENAGFRFSLSHKAEEAVSFNVSTNLTTGNHAAGPDDFVSVTNHNVVIPIGQTEAFVNIETLVDELEEGVEEFQLKTTSNIENARLRGISRLSATGSIIDCKKDTFLILKNATCREGDNLDFQLRLSSPVQRDITISYHTEDITSTSGNDYQYSSGDIFINKGETTAQISVQTLIDQEQEDDERMKLVIDQVTEGIILCCKEGYGTICDNAFPIAVDDRIICLEDSTCSGNVLDNDIPGDGELIVVDFTTPTYGTLTLAENGDLSFTPPIDYTGEQVISYTAEDADGDQCSADITIVVENVNDKPIANNDSYEINENESITDNVLLNDTGLGDTPISVIFKEPKQGTLDGSNDGSFTYTPPIGFYGEIIFSYRVEDADGEYCTAFVKVKVNFSNDYAPVAVDDAFSTQENTPRNLPILNNDYDQDGNETIDRQSISIERNPVTGSASILVAEGEIKYTPTADWTGKDSLQYSVADHGGQRSNTAWVIIQVKSITETPVAKAKNITVPLDETGFVAIAPEDVDNGSYDPDGQEIQFAVVPFEFTCENIGTNSVTLTVTDTDGLSCDADAIVTVIDNFPPEVVDGTCPDEIQIPTDSGTKGAIVEYSTPRFRDNCGGDDIGGSLTAGLPSGSFFPLGITQVQYEYTDNSNNGPAICSFNVIVIDAEAPLVKCPDDIEKCIVGENLVVENISVVATDNITETDNLIVSYTITGATTKSGQGDASGETFNLGESIVTYEVEDAYHNITECSFKITLYPTPETLPIQPMLP